MQTDHCCEFLRFDAGTFANRDLNKKNCYSYDSFNYNSSIYNLHKSIYQLSIESNRIYHDT